MLMRDHEQFKSRSSVSPQSMTF